MKNLPSRAALSASALTAIVAFGWDFVCPGRFHAYIPAAIAVSSGYMIDCIRSSKP